MACKEADRSKQGNCVIKCTQLLLQVFQSDLLKSVSDSDARSMNAQELSNTLIKYIDTTGLVQETIFATPDPEYSADCKDHNTNQI